jgi:hypothetical protein
MSDTDVHTCHDQCPCRTGGQPTPDFLPVEGSLLPGLLARDPVYDLDTVLHALDRLAASRGVEPNQATRERWADVVVGLMDPRMVLFTVAVDAAPAVLRDLADGLDSHSDEPLTYARLTDLTVHGAE